MFHWMMAFQLGILLSASKVPVTNADDHEARLDAEAACLRVVIRDGKNRLVELDRVLTVALRAINERDTGPVSAEFVDQVNQIRKEIAQEQELLQDAKLRLFRLDAKPGSQVSDCRSTSRSNR